MIVQKMEILPVNDLDVALHNFVNKDDKMAFYSCLRYNLEETRVSTVYYILFPTFSEQPLVNLRCDGWCISKSCVDIINAFKNIKYNLEFLYHIC